MPHIADEQRLTFRGRGSSTGRAMAEFEQGNGKRFGFADELFADLGI